MKDSVTMSLVLLDFYDGAFQEGDSKDLLFVF